MGKIVSVQGGILEAPYTSAAVFRKERNTSELKRITAFQASLSGERRSLSKDFDLEDH
jgi:hypothetical protein